MSNYHLIQEWIAMAGDSQPRSKAEGYFLKLGGSAFQEMKKYLTDIEQDFRIKRIQKRRYYKDQKAANPEWNDLIDKISMRDDKELNLDFTRLLYGSSLVASFTIFEVILKKVCVLAAHKSSQKVPQNLLAGTIIDCRSYIVSSLRIDISGVDTHWKRLIKYRNLRNVIVHHNGIVVKETETIVKFLKELEYVQVRKVRNKDQFMFTILERGFIFDFLNCAAQFIFHILERLPKGKRNTLPNITQHK